MAADFLFCSCKDSARWAKCKIKDAVFYFAFPNRRLSSRQQSSASRIQNKIKKHFYFFCWVTNWTTHKMKPLMTILRIISEWSASHHHWSLRSKLYLKLLFKIVFKILNAILSEATTSLHPMLIVHIHPLQAREHRLDVLFRDGDDIFRIGHPDKCRKHLWDNQ